jgi:hypothetical protein
LRGPEKQNHRKPLFGSPRNFNFNILSMQDITLAQKTIISALYRSLGVGFFHGGSKNTKSSPTGLHTFEHIMVPVAVSNDYTKKVKSCFGCS